MPTPEQIADWKCQVSNDDTRLGLDDWVSSQMDVEITKALARLYNEITVEKALMERLVQKIAEI